MIAGSSVTRPRRRRGFPLPKDKGPDIVRPHWDRVVHSGLLKPHQTQGYCVLVVLVTALIKSWGRRLTRLVARAMLVSPLLRW